MRECAVAPALYRTDLSPPPLNHTHACWMSAPCVRFGGRIRVSVSYLLFDRSRRVGPRSVPTYGLYFLTRLLILAYPALKSLSQQGIFNLLHHVTIHCLVTPYLSATDLKHVLFAKIVFINSCLSGITLIPK